MKEDSIQIIGDQYHTLEMKTQHSSVSPDDLAQYLRSIQQTYERLKQIQRHIFQSSYGFDKRGLEWVLHHDISSFDPHLAKDIETCLYPFNDIVTQFEETYKTQLDFIKAYGR